MTDDDVIKALGPPNGGFRYSQIGGRYGEMWYLEPNSRDLAQNSLSISLHGPGGTLSSCVIMHGSEFRSADTRYFGPPCTADTELGRCGSDGHLD